MKALIWDVDGTMAETEEAHREAYNHAFRAFGLGWRWSLAEYMELLRVAGGRERILSYIETRRPALPGGAPHDVLAARLHEAKNERYTAMLRDNRLSARPGVIRLMRQARAEGVRQAVCTSSSKGNVLPLLDAIAPGGSGLFDCLICGEDAVNKKPDPHAYRLALDCLGLAPGECLALEDSDSGVRAAVAAGIPVVAVPGLYSPRDGFDGALAVLTSLGDPDAPASAVRSPEPFGPGMVDVPALRRWLKAEG